MSLPWPLAEAANLLGMLWVALLALLIKAARRSGPSVSDDDPPQLEEEGTWPLG